MGGPDRLLTEITKAMEGKMPDLTKEEETALGQLLRGEQGWAEVCELVREAYVFVLEHLK